ncbi:MULTISPECIES: hypothetical protein [unclassified Nocardia]|uniref:hypothetical protein n=1 Tax=unclassified Nocardia TaxID=2637762 RepID=UPI001CE3D204|nr:MULTISPECIES: hypothetical protein [unclassified Nocardia]
MTATGETGVTGLLEFQQCACPDCTDTGIVRPSVLCNGCENAGCLPGHGRCQRDDAYDGYARREALVTGQRIQQQYDQGRSWAVIADEFEISKSKAQRLAKVYRAYRDWQTHHDQLSLLG